MKVAVKLFAVAKQFAGEDELELHLDDPTVGSLRAALLARLPQLAPMEEALRFAVNSDYADDATPLTESDEVACIPPVSGG